MANSAPEAGPDVSEFGRPVSSIDRSCRGAQGPLARPNARVSEVQAMLLTSGRWMLSNSHAKLGLAVAVTYSRLSRADRVALVAKPEILHNLRLNREA